MQKQKAQTRRARAFPILTRGDSEKDFVRLKKFAGANFHAARARRVKARMAEIKA